jgi:nucleoside 2-deoxyribosyltransferase
MRSDCGDFQKGATRLSFALRGADADSGMCVELGYAWARRKPVVGVRTDFRVSEDRGLNLMVSHVCQVLLLQTSEDLESLSKKICAALAQIPAP